MRHEQQLLEVTRYKWTRFQDFKYFSLSSILSLCDGVYVSVRKYKLDGVSAWSMLNNNSGNIRTEVLHNIDPIFKFAGLRVGDYKLVTGDIDQG